MRRFPSLAWGNYHNPHNTPTKAALTQLHRQAAFAMESIPRHRFRILTLVRDPMADALGEELAWYRDPREVVIGTVFRDVTDNDYAFVLLGRDEHSQFRWIDGGA